MQPPLNTMQRPYHQSRRSSRPVQQPILRPSSLSLKTLRWKSSSLILFLGPIGKLQNILVWIKRSPLRCELLHKLQLQLALTRPEGRNETYELITDVVTR